MDPMPKSGLYYPNRIALIIMQALEDVMGKNGMNAILNLAHLSNLIDNYPASNLERQFDFSDVSSLSVGLEEMYGPRGGRGLALRAGRAAFADSLRNFGAMAGAGDLAFKVLRVNAKLKTGVPARATIFPPLSDQKSTADGQRNHTQYNHHQCPVCWGRSGEEKPVCFIAAGLLQEGLKWLSGGNEFRVNESECVAMGAEVCKFVVQKEPIG